MTMARAVFVLQHSEQRIVMTLLVGFLVCFFKELGFFFIIIRSLALLS